MSEHELSWFEFYRKNFPQHCAVSGGLAVMLISGLQVGWIFNNDLIDFPWARGHSSIEIAVTYASFYVAAITGLYFASITVIRLPKTNIYYSTLTFAAWGSFCIIVMPRSLYLMIVARALIGFGHGYAYLTIIVHASEIVTQKLRGLVIASVNVCMMISIFVFGIFTATLDHEKHGLGAMQWVGIVGLNLSAVGISLTLLLTYESPVPLIRDFKLDQALSIMIKVRSESEETWNIKNEYNELKTMVDEDDQTTDKIFEEGNIRPMILITLLKVGSVLSFNFGLNTIRLENSTMFKSFSGTNYAVIVLMMFRLVACFISLYTIDSRRRRHHFLVSFGGSSAVLIAMSAIIAFGSTKISWTFGLLQISYEVFGGFGMAMIADVYSSEAFNTTKKINSIYFTTAVEYMMHIFLITLTHNIRAKATFNWVFLLGSGILLLLITIFLHKKLPETAKMSIRQTRNEFLKPDVEEIPVVIQARNVIFK